MERLATLSEMAPVSPWPPTLPIPALNPSPPKRDAAAVELLATVRSQLDVDAERAGEVERLMRVVDDVIAQTKAAKGGLGRVDRV